MMQSINENMKHANMNAKAAHRIALAEHLVGKLAASVLRQEQLRSDRKHDATLAKVLASKPVDYAHVTFAAGGRMVSARAPKRVVKLTKTAARQLCWAAVAAEMAR